MVKMKCHHCGHVWDYTGKAKYYATCPTCHYKVNMRKHRVGAKGQKKLALKRK